MEEKKQIKLGINATKKPVFPVLGKPEHADGGSYVIKNRAFIGQTYMIVCPQCHQPMLVKAASTKPHKVACKQCNTPIYYIGKERGTEKFPPNRKLHARLTWGGIFKRKHYDFTTLGEHYIGRIDKEVKSDVMIDDEFASRRSVVIDVMPKSGDYNYLLTVKHATNPVRVNGIAKETGESVYLNYGDTILIGNTTLTFKKREK